MRCAAEYLTLIRWSAVDGKTNIILPSRSRPPGTQRPTHYNTSSFLIRWVINAVQYFQYFVVHVLVLCIHVSWCHTWNRDHSRFQQIQFVTHGDVVFNGLWRPIASSMQLRRRHTRVTSSISEQLPYRYLKMTNTYIVTVIQCTCTTTTCHLSSDPH